MKRKQLIFLLLICTVMLSAQQVTVVKNYQVMQNLEKSAYYPVISPDGQQLLFTSESYTGLSLYDLSSGKQQKVTDAAGAGFDPAFASDEKTILFTEESKLDGRRYKSLMSFERVSGNRMELVAPQRSNLPLKAAKQQRMQKKASTVSVSTEDLKLVLYRNGVRKVMEPVGQVAGYVWASLSPDNTKILFTAASKGTYICDLEGNVLASLGKLNAPAWYGNQFVVGMDDTDNGDFITSSSVLIVSADGKMRQNLTPENQVAMYPTASAQSNRIAYNTLDGKIYVMEIAINQ